MIDDVLSSLPKTTQSISDKIDYQNILDLINRFLQKTEMVNSILFVISLCVIYYFFNKHLIKKYALQNPNSSSNDNNEEDQEVNKLKVKKIVLRNSLILIFIIGSIFIWKEEIKTVLLSVSFALVALVVLFRDFLLNIFSSFIISTRKDLSIGNVIQYKNTIGTIVDRTLLSTKIILKDNNFNTSQELVVQNFSLLNSEITNLNRLKHYTIHFLNVYVKEKEDVLLNMKLLKTAADEVLEKRNKKLKEYRKTLVSKENISIPPLKSFCFCDLSEKIYISLKFVCDDRYVAYIKQEILNKYLQLLEKESKDKKVNIIT